MNKFFKSLILLEFQNNPNNVINRMSNVLNNRTMRSINKTNNIINMMMKENKNFINPSPKLISISTIKKLIITLLKSYKGYV